MARQRAGARFRGMRSRPGDGRPPLPHPAACVGSHPRQGDLKLNIQNHRREAFWSNCLRNLQYTCNGFLERSSASARRFQVVQRSACGICWCASCIKKVCWHDCKLQDSCRQQRAKCESQAIGNVWVSLADMRLPATLHQRLCGQTEAPRCDCGIEDERRCPGTSGCWRRICKDRKRALSYES